MNVRNQSRSNLTEMVDIYNDVTNCSISELLHQSIENIIVALNQITSFSEHVPGKSFPCAKRRH